MGKKGDPRTVVAARVSVEHYLALEQHAQVNDRTVSQQIGRYIREGLERDGVLPATKKQTNSNDRS